MWYLPNDKILHFDSEEPMCFLCLIAQKGVFYQDASIYSLGFANTLVFQHQNVKKPVFHDTYNCIKSTF